MDAFVKPIFDHAGFAEVLPEATALAMFAAVLLGLVARSYARRVYSPG